MNFVPAEARYRIPKECDLYIVSAHADGPIKIGRSKNAYARLLELQTGNPRKLYVLKCWTMAYEDALEAERVLHEELDDSRLEGEWFDLSEEFIVEYMPDFFAANGFVKDEERQNANA